MAGAGAGPLPAGRRRRGGGAGRVGLVLLAILAAVAVAAPQLAPYHPAARTGQPFARPSLAHPLGTNDVGQDLLSELFFGARVSLAVGVTAALAATGVGVLVGLVAGYRRRWLDAVLMRMVDVVLCLPFLPLMIVIGVFLGPGLATQLAVIAGVTWAGVARELRAQVLTVRERDHVQAAASMGAHSPHVLARHVLPAVAPLVMPQFVLATKTAILLEASLSFLGLGDATARSWGMTLYYAHARSAFLTDAWLWWVVPPGLCIAAAVLAFALVGYDFEQRSLPQLRARVGPARRPRSEGQGTIPVPRGGAPVLELRHLSIAYEAPGGRRPVLAVDDVTLSISQGEILGLVGESGSGKSTVGAAAGGLLRPPATIQAGQVLVNGSDLATLSAEGLRRLHGNRVALVPQQAMSALNPVFRVGDQLAEAVTVHRRVSRHHARERAAELLALVRLDCERADDYPHQLSGGMRQRVVLAMALANDPDLLIADEPITGLDVVLQAQILALLDELRRRLNLSMLVISHDLAAVSRLADRLAVMHQGRIVGQGPVEGLASQSTHPYVRTLLEAAPRLRALPAGAPGGR